MFDVSKPAIIPELVGTTGATSATTPQPVPEISGAAFEQTMRELGYPGWYRDDRVTRAIEVAWQECCEMGSRTPFDIAHAARKHNLPPLPRDKWIPKDTSHAR
jgi:hypothetical protein